MERTFTTFMGKVKVVPRTNYSNGETFYEIYDKKDDFLCEFHTCSNIEDSHFEDELNEYLEWEIG